MSEPKPEDTSGKPPPKIKDIDDERKYTTREAGGFLGIQWRTVVQHIRSGRITAEQVLERRGPTYYILGSEIKRYQKERLPAHRPKKSISDHSNRVKKSLDDSTDDSIE